MWRLALFEIAYHVGLSVENNPEDYSCHLSRPFLVGHFSKNTFPTEQAAQDLICTSLKRMCAYSSLTDLLLPQRARALPALITDITPSHKFQRKAGTLFCGPEDNLINRIFINDLLLNRWRTFADLFDDCGIEGVVQGWQACAAAEAVNR
jgi:hypothetical protein